MSKSPAFRFYPSDFMGSPDVQAMDLHEVGAYTYLLCTAWLSDRHGYLPDDEEKLRRWAHMNREQWAESRASLLAKFPVAEEGWRSNPRMVLKANKQSAFSDSQRRKIEKRWANRTEGGITGVSQNGTGVSDSDTGVIPSVSVSVSEKKESKSADAPAAPAERKAVVSGPTKPDGPATAEELSGIGIAPQDFDAYMAVRRKKSWAFIDTATRERWLAKFRRYYAEGKDTQDMLHQMIEGQWQGQPEEKWKQRPRQVVVLTPEEQEREWDDVRGITREVLQ